MLAVSLFLSYAPLNAQTSDATVQGTVVDQAGAAVANATITLLKNSTSNHWVAVTNQRGAYVIPNVEPGIYRLIINAPGFIALESELTKAAGSRLLGNFQMTAGDAMKTMHVAIAPQLSGTVSSVPGGVADANAVSNLPSNGRDWTQSATLQAGVSSVKTQPDAGNTSSGRGQRGFGAQISVSGGRPQQNNYVLNGTSINDYANSAPGSVLGLDLGADAVDQVSVITSNYPADYGRSSGGVINAVTRSGGDRFHGSFYEFFRNSALDTKNYFDSAKPPFKRNQFGVSAGGPIRKDRTFFFANFEGLRQSLGVTKVNTVPSPAARAGQLSTGNVQVDAEAARYLAFFPLPNRGLLGTGDTGVFAVSGQQVTPENYFTGRIDHMFGEKDKLTGSYVFDSAQTTQPDAFNLRINAIQTRRNLLSLSETHTFNQNALNTVRFGVNRVVAHIGLTPEALNPIAADTSYGFLPGRTAGNINILGLTNFTGGLGAAPPFDFHWTSIQAYDDFAFTRGAHAVRFGVAFERMLDNMLATSDPNGVFVFHSLSDFLTNQPFSLSVALTGNPTPRDLRQTLFGAYVQDDWKIRPNLTVNLGLRYETTSVPTEVAGRLSTLRAVTDATPHIGDPYFSNPTRKNFEPRIGLSWDPTGAGKLSVRSGFGIFDVLPLPYEFELLSLFAPPFFENATPNNLPAGSFPAGAIQIASTAHTFRNVYIEPHPRRNYVEAWNLSLQWQPAKAASLLVAYVGSRGIHQPFRADDTNMVLPVLTPQGYAWPLPIGTGTKLNPHVGRLDQLIWKGNSYYHGLQVQAQDRLLKSLDLQASYTWGKSIDTGSATVAGDQFANSVSSLPWYDLQLSRGLSDFDIRHTLSVHFTYQFPKPAHFDHWYARDWRINGTFQASSGAPFTPVIGGDPLGTLSTDPYDVPNRVAAPGCGKPTNSGNPNGYLKLQCFAFPNPVNVLGNLGRNSVIGPGLRTVDFSLFKDTFRKKSGEGLNIQFRVDVFNVFNHPNFLPPLDHRDLFDGNGNPVSGAGLIDATATPSRQMQLGVKVIW
jgi:hypothetical protein